MRTGSVNNIVRCLALGFLTAASSCKQEINYVHPVSIKEVPKYVVETADFFEKATKNIAKEADMEKFDEEIIEITEKMSKDPRESLKELDQRALDISPQIDISYNEKDKISKNETAARIYIPMMTPARHRRHDFLYKYFIDTIKAVVKKGRNYYTDDKGGKRFFIDVDYYGIKNPKWDEFVKETNNNP